MLNPLVYQHVHFDGVVCLDVHSSVRTLSCFQAVAECFHQHSWWLEPNLFRSEFCPAGLSAAVDFDLNKLGKVAQLTNSICLKVGCLYYGKNDNGRYFY